MKLDINRVRGLLSFVLAVLLALLALAFASFDDVNALALGYLWETTFCVVLSEFYFPKRAQFDRHNVTSKTIHTIGGSF